MLKRIGLALLIVLVGIQFLPSRSNQRAEVLSTDFVKTFNVPENIANSLSTSCYNCHSNTTDYPWYSYVQPVGLLLENHINKGKSELNLSEFGNYSVRKQRSKIKSMISQIEKGEMPIASYTFIHRDARLSPENKETITNYFYKLLDSLE